MRLIFLILFIFPVFVFSQSSMSIQDSLKVSRFLDLASKYSIFSFHRANYLDSVLKIQPTNANVWQQKAMPLFKQMKYEAGMAFLDSAVKYDHSNYWKEYRAFIKCVFQKNYASSIDDFLSVKKNNENGFVMEHSFNFYIGLAYLQLTNQNLAEEYIRKSIIFSENRFKEAHFVEYFYMGILNMEKDSFETAISYFDKSLNFYPKFSDAEYYKAMCLIGLKKKDEANELLKDVLVNYKAGYTFTEDNAWYEKYPYQLRDFHLKGLEERVRDYKKEEK